MTDTGLSVLMLIGGGVFIIASIILTFAMASTNRWLMLFIVAIFGAWVSSFIFDFGQLYGQITGFILVLSLLIPWLILIFSIAAGGVIWIVDHWKFLLITAASLSVTAIGVYTIVEYNFYREFFYCLLALTLLSAVIGKPPQVRYFFLSLTRVSVIIVSGFLFLYGIGAVTYLFFNHGFGILLEIGSERFWVAWSGYVLFTEWLFGFIIVNTLILMFLPGGITVPNFLASMIISQGERDANAERVYKSAKRQHESKGRDW